MKKFVIDRTRWYRGQGCSSSALLKEDGTMCCLGQMALQCGYNADDIIYMTEPNSLSLELKEKFPDYIIDPETHRQTSLCNSMMGINDDYNLTDNERESVLKELVADNGDELEFIN